MARPTPLFLAASLLFAAFSAARSQGLDDLLGGVGGVVSDPEKLKKADSCDQFLDAGYRKYEDACSEAGARSEWQGGCPEECKSFWAGLSQDCKDTIDDLGVFPMNGGKASEFFDANCGGGTAPNDGDTSTPTPSTPTPSTPSGPSAAGQSGQSYGERYFCRDLPAEYASCETGVALKDSMKTPAADAAPTDGVLAYMAAATTSFAGTYSISCTPDNHPRVLCQNSYDPNSWLVIFDIDCGSVGKGTLGAWGTNQDGDGKISGEVSWYSYNNIICDAGIKAGETDAAPSTPSTPGAPADDDGGDDSDDASSGTAVKCADPLPADLASCGSGTLSGYYKPLSDVGSFTSQAVEAYNRDYAPYTGHTCSNAGAARIACVGDAATSWVAIFDVDCASLGTVTMGAWGTDADGDGNFDTWSYIDEKMCKQ